MSVCADSQQPPDDVTDGAGDAGAGDAQSRRLRQTEGSQPTPGSATPAA